MNQRNNQWSVAPLPVYKTYNPDGTVAVQGKSAAHSLGYGVAINKNSQMKDKAWKFVKWVAGEGQRLFAENGYLLELGYCFLLSDILKDARAAFIQAREFDKRANWALFMTNLFLNLPADYPSYFELRNFLEIDLNILIQAGKGEFVEKLISYADFFYTINPEVYKYLGRVFLNNDLEQYGYFSLMRAKDYFYNDPELHYLLAEFFFNKKDFKEAKKYAQTCLEVLPEYFPAKKMLEKIADAV